MGKFFQCYLQQQGSDGHGGGGGGDACGYMDSPMLPDTLCKAYPMLVDTAQQLRCFTPSNPDPYTHAARRAQLNGSQQGEEAAAPQLNAPTPPPIAAYLCESHGCEATSCAPIQPNETKRRCNPSATQPWMGMCFNTSAQCEGGCVAPPTPAPPTVYVCDPTSNTCSLNCSSMYNPKPGLPQCELNDCDGCSGAGAKCT